MFENASQHNEQQHEKMAQEGRKKTVNDVLDVWNPVFENASQHNEQQCKKMAQEGRRKTISDNLDKMHQVFENMRQHNKLRREQGGLLIWHASM